MSQHVRSYLTRRYVQQLHLSQLLATSIAATRRCRALKTNDAETQKLRASSVDKLAKLPSTPGWFVHSFIRQYAATAPLQGSISGIDHVRPTFIWYRLCSKSADDSCILFGERDYVIALHPTTICVGYCRAAESTPVTVRTTCTIHE